MPGIFHRQIASRCWLVPRTPFAKSGTSLKDLHAEDLAKCVIQETLYRANFPASRVDEVILGNVIMPADAANVARVAALFAGVPREVPGLTVQRNCASGMESINEASMRIRSGMGRVMVAGGTESMSNVPLLFPAETMEPVGQLARAKTSWQKTIAVSRLRPKHFRPVAGLELGLTDPTVNMIMGKTAEVLVQEFGITRKEQDDYAMRSHEKAVHASNAGLFDEEIFPVYAGPNYEPVTRDNGPRANTTLESLAKLRPLFDRKDGSVTVGNSCQITDGAAALLVADAAFAGAEGMDALGYVKAYAYAALDPIANGPGPGVRYS